MIDKLAIVYKISIKIDFKTYIFIGHNQSPNKKYSFFIFI